MTETELTDRLREAIVLNGPDVWRTNGYLEDARQAGIPQADAIKQATEISQDVANNNLLFQNIQARIARMAQPSRAQLYDQDLNQIVNAASSLKLSPDFVRNKWVPTVLNRIAAELKARQAEPVVAPAPPPVVAPIAAPMYDELIEPRPETPKPSVTGADLAMPSPAVVESPVYIAPPVAPVERPVKPPSPPEPAPIVRSFTATPARVQKGQPVTLAWDVENLLAVTIDDLGEGLSPKNRGWVKPTKTSDYTLFDANNNPLSTVRIDVIQPDRSGLYGVLFALALLAIIYWFIKSNNASDNTPPKSSHQTEQTRGTSNEDGSGRKKKVNQEEPPAESEPATEATNPQPTETTSEPTVALPDNTPKTEGPIPRSTPADNTASTEPALKPSTPADARQGKYEEAFGDKPYDKVELGADERGWRRARSNGRWGFINEADEWVIRPEFEAVTPFRGNTAAVFLNGQLMKINREGEQVRNN